MDGSGNIYIANQGHQVLKGTLSGNNNYVQSSIGTGLGVVVAVAVDGSGNVYIADIQNRQVVKETPSGTSYIQSTVASLPPGSLFPMWGVAVDGSGNVYIEDPPNNRILKETPSGNSYSQSIVVSGLPFQISSIAADAGGNVYFTDGGDHAVVKETLISGTYQQTLVGNTGPNCIPNSVAVDTNGIVYIAGENTTFSGGSITQSAAAFVETPLGNSYVQSTIAIAQTIPATIAAIATNGSGNFYIAANGIPVLDEAPVYGNLGSVNVGSASPQPVSMIFTFDTGGTLGSKAVLTQGASGLDFTDAGSDTCTANTQYSTGETCTVNVSFTPKFAGTRDGAVVLYDTSGNTIATGYLQGTGVGPQINFLPGIQSVLGSGFNSPVGVAVDGSGNMYVADYGNNAVKEILAVNGSVPASPTIRTLGVGFNRPMSVALDSAGNLYVADSGNNSVKEILAVNDGIPASPAIITLGSGFNSPSAAVVDHAGNVFVADSGNNAIKEIVAVNGSIPATPTILTLENATLAYYLAVDGSGNLYFTGYNSPVVELLAVNGSIPTSPTGRIIGGTPAFATGIAVDSNGNIYVANNQSTVSEIHAVNGSIPSSPTVTTLSSTFKFPTGLAMDGNGNIYVSDTANNRIVKVDLADTPSLTFASAAVGSSSTDSPKILTIENNGNAILNLPIPASGDNPSIGPDFTLNENAPGACPVGTSGSSTAETLAPGTTCTLAISFAPTVSGPLNESLALTDNNLNASSPAYATQSISLSGTGVATPTITWSAPVAITYGTPLSATQLNATASVPGTFSYSPAAGTVLTAGTQTITVTFTPTDTTNYTTATASVALVVNQATPTITWPAPTAITYGAPLGSAQLNASTIVPGTFVYSPAAGTVLTAGSQTLTVTFTPTDTTDYTAATATITFTVNQATPTITWPTPAAITYGTPLGSAQLDASTTVAGTFVYSPAAGTVLTAGTQTLTATFTPTDSTDYTAATSTVTLTVNQATPSITWATPAAITYGTALGALQLNAGSTVAGTFSYSPAAGTVLTAGTQTLTVTFTPTDMTNYTTATTTVTLTVNQATPAIMWATPAAITYGTPLGSAQLNASSVVAGTLSYSPTAGTVLTAGMQTLGVTFTPTDTADYNIATATVALTVNQAAPVITWAAPAAITYGTPLGSAQLDATANVPGIFSYSPGAGTVLGVGTQPLTVVFAPADLVDYAPASASVSLTVTLPSFVPSSANLGTVKIGTAGPVQTLTVTFSAPVTLGSIAVTTQGASGLDFRNTGTGTCTANAAYSAGQSCTVNVLFTPSFAGKRYGAAVVYDSTGNVLATAYLQGTGVGPQIDFLPGTESIVASASAGVTCPYAIAVDGSTSIYIADCANNVIWKETPSSSGYTQSTIPTSSLNGPVGVAVDGAGNVYISDIGNNRVLKETLSPAGYTESVVADSAHNNFESPIAIAVDGSGNVFFTATDMIVFQENVYEMTPSPTGYTQSNIPLSGVSPTGLAVDGNGNVYIADLDNSQVVKETPSAGGYIQSPLPIDGLFQPNGIAVDAMGNIYVANLGGGPVFKETPVAGTYVQSIIPTSQLNEPLALAVDRGGNLYVADAGTQEVLKEDLADPPSLSFANTPIGSVSADSPRTVTVLNAGNAALTFNPPPPDAGSVISPGFILNRGVSSPCPVSGTGSSTPGTLAAGASCQLSLSFVPTAIRAFSGSIVLADNSLYPANPPYVMQRITLSGTGTRITPSIIWNMPAPITYGTSLSSKQLNASSKVAGKFTYTPAAGKVLGAGQQTLTVTFTPNDGVNYTTATASVTLTVNPATPIIKWAAPAAIAYGTPLSSSQLDATANVPGTFAYTPTAGTVLDAGNQTLRTTFTPTDSADYNTATDSVILSVKGFTLSASPSSLTVTPGKSGTDTITVTDINGFNSSVTLSASGLPSGVIAAFGINPTTGKSVLTFTVSKSAAPGSHTVIITGVSGPSSATTTISLTI